jgi:2-oxoisovalerate dehydrogenase E2 component (dihydrolipoyl transacylase)
MASAVRMPQLGESVTEGTVLRWLKQPGEHVALDESLAEVETEKVNVEIPSPYEGTLTELLVPEGETVPVGTPIATIEASAGMGEPQTGASIPGPTRVSEAPPAAMPQTRVAGKPASAPAARRPAAAFSATGPLGPAGVAHGMFSTGEDATDRAPHARGPLAVPAPGSAAPADAPEPAHTPGGAARYSPAVLRLAGEHGVELSALRGSGIGGRITRKDVQAWIKGGAKTGSSAVAVEPEEAVHTFAGGVPAIAPAGSQTVENLQDSFDLPLEEPQAVAPSRRSPGATLEAKGAETGRDDEELEPLTATRRAIAAHMSRSVQTSPHAWMMVEVDVTRLVALRERIKQDFHAREGVDLSYLPFMIKATVAALIQHPRLNSSWSDAGVVLKRRINIGIAADTPMGLVVPVIRDADRLSIAGLARAIGDLASRARARKLRLDDVQGGTFTVDNVGPIGSILSQPIINQPQCAIVTMESIVKRPIVVADAIAIRSIMNCCISFDHRIVDGGDIGPFMKTLKQNLETMGDETPIF